MSSSPADMMTRGLDSPSESITFVTSPEVIPITSSFLEKSDETAFTVEDHQMLGIEDVMNLISEIVKNDRRETEIIKWMKDQVNDCMSHFQKSDSEVVMPVAVSDFKKKLKAIEDELKVLEHKVSTFSNNFEEKYGIQKERQKKLEQLRRSLDEAHSDLSTSFFKIVTSKKDQDERNILAEGQKYKEKVEDVQMIVDSLREEMACMLNSVQSRERQIMQAERCVCKQKELMKNLNDCVSYLTDANKLCWREKDKTDKVLLECVKKFSCLQSQLSLTKQDKAEALEKLEMFSESFKNYIENATEEELELLFKKFKKSVFKMRPHRACECELDEDIPRKMGNDFENIARRAQVFEREVERLSYVVRQYQYAILKLKDTYPYMADVIDPQLLMEHKDASPYEFAEFQKALLTSKLKAKREQAFAKDIRIKSLEKSVKKPQVLCAVHPELTALDEDHNTKSYLEALRVKLADYKRQIMEYKEELQTLEITKSSNTPEFVEVYNSKMMSKLKLYEEQAHLQDSIINLMKSLQDNNLQKSISFRSISLKSTTKGNISNADMLLENKKSQIVLQRKIIDSLLNMKVMMDSEIKKQQNLDYHSVHDGKKSSLPNDERFHELQASLNAALQEIATHTTLIEKLEREKMLPRPESDNQQVTLLYKQLQQYEHQIEAQEDLIKHLENVLEQSRMKYEDVLNMTQSSPRLSLDECLRRSQQEIRTLKEQVAEKQSESDRLMLDMDESDYTQVTESSDVDSLISKMVEYEDEIESKNKIISSLEEGMKEVEDQNETLLQRYKDLIRNFNMVLIEKDRPQSELQKMQMSYDYDQTRKEVLELSDEVSSLNHQLNMVKDSLQNKEKIISHMDETIRALKDSFNVQTQETTDLQFRFSILGAENQEYEKQMKTMEGDMQILRHQLEMEKEEKSRILVELSQNNKEMENQQIVMTGLKQALISTKQQLQELEGKGFDGACTGTTSEERSSTNLETSDLWRKYCNCLFEVMKQQSLLYNIKDEILDLQTHECPHSDQESSCENIPNATVEATNITEGGASSERNKITNATYRGIMSENYCLRCEIKRLKKTNTALRNDNLSLLSIIKKLGISHTDDSSSDEVAFEVCSSFSQHAQSTVVDDEEVMESLTSLQTQIKKQTIIIKELQKDRKKNEENLALLEHYQDRCYCLEMLQDDFKNLQKKYDDLKLQNEKLKYFQKKVDTFRCSDGFCNDMATNQSRISGEDYDVSGGVLERELQQQNRELFENNNLLTSDVARLEHENQELVNNLSVAEERLTKAREAEALALNKLKEFRVLNEKLESQSTDLRNKLEYSMEVSRRHEMHATDLQQQVEHLKQEITVSSQHYEQLIKKMEYDSRETLNKNSLLEMEAAKLKAEINKLKKSDDQEAALQRELQSCQEMIFDLRSDYQNQILELQNKDSQISQLEMDCKVSQNKLANLIMENQHLIQQVQMLQHELESMKSNCKQSDIINHGLQSKNNEMMSEMIVLKQELADKESQYLKRLGEYHHKEAKQNELIELLNANIQELNNKLEDHDIQLRAVTLDAQLNSTKTGNLQKDLEIRTVLEKRLQKALTKQNMKVAEITEKLDIKNNEVMRLKSENSHLNSLISQLQEQNALSQGPERDVTTEQVINLQRETDRLNAEVSRLTALCEAHNSEEISLRRKLKNLSYEAAVSRHSCFIFEQRMKQCVSNNIALFKFNRKLENTMLHLEQQLYILKQQYLNKDRALTMLENEFHQSQRQAGLVCKYSEGDRPTLKNEKCVDSGTADSRVQTSQASKNSRDLLSCDKKLNFYIDSCRKINAKMATSFSNLRISRRKTPGLRRSSYKLKPHHPWSDDTNSSDRSDEDQYQ